MSLSADKLTQGLRYLARRDADLATVLDRLGAPPLWSREPGFPTLIQIILEQQVSLASAKAAYDRLAALAFTSPLTPHRLLEIDDINLNRIGFSRQKITYSRHLARSIIDGSLDLEALHTMNDLSARAALLKIKGIGVWTTDIYLLMALGRPDVWPSGDLALAVAVQNLKELPERPAPRVLEEIGTAWRPWRAVAARLLWHYYLNRSARLTTA